MRVKTRWNTTQSNNSKQYKDNLKSDKTKRSIIKDRTDAKTLNE